MFYTYILRSSTIRISVTSGVRLIYANASPYTMRAVFHIRRNSDRGKWKPISPLRRKSWLVPSKSISNPAAVTFSPSATSEKAKVVNEAVLVHRSLGEGGRLRFMARQASLHAPKVRFMLCGVAAKRFMCRRHASSTTFPARLTMKHCRVAPI